MARTGTDLLALLAGRQRPAAKTAAVEVTRGGSNPQYRQLAAARPTVLNSGARPTVLGGTSRGIVLGGGGGLSNPVTRAQYFKAFNNQSSNRAALGSRLIAQQSRVSPGVMRDATSLWKRDNSALLKSHPQLGRFAGFFAANPSSWRRFQTSAGLGGGATPSRTVSSTPVARQAAQQAVAARPQRPSSVAPAAPQNPIAAAKPVQARTAVSGPVAAQAAKQAPVAGRPTYADCQKGKVSYRDFMRGSVGRPQLAKGVGSAQSPVQPAAKAGPAAAKPRSGIVTWSPGQALPGMSMEQTKAYQSKLGKGGIKKSAQAYTLAPPAPPKVQQAPVKTPPVRYGLTGLGSDPNSIYAQSIRKKWTDAAAKRVAAMKPPKGTGNPHYDKRPDVVARTQEEDAERRYEEYYKTLPQYVQHDDPRVAEAWVKHQETWGQKLDRHPTLKKLFSVPVRMFNAAMENPGATMAGPGGAGGFQHDLRNPNAPKADPEDVAHDFANQAQYLWNNVSQGAENAVSGAWKYIASPWNRSTHARNVRHGHDVRLANSQRLTDALNRKILADSRTGLDDMSNPVARANRVLGERLAPLYGEVVAGTALTAGAGNVAGLGSKAIGAGTKLVRVPVAARTARGAMRLGVSPGAARSVGHAVGGGVTEIGNALRMPLNAVSAVSRSTLHPAQAARGVGALPTVRTATRVVTNPNAAFQYAARHPWKATGRVVGGALKPLFSPGLYNGMQLYSAYDNAANGRYGSAAGDMARIGGYGLLSRINPWIGMPGMVLADYALSGGDDGLE